MGCYTINHDTIINNTVARITFIIKVSKVKLGLPYNFAVHHIQHYLILKIRKSFVR